MANALPPSQSILRMPLLPAVFRIHGRAAAAKCADNADNGDIGSIGRLPVHLIWSAGQTVMQRNVQKTTNSKLIGCNLGAQNRQMINTI